MKISHAYRKKLCALLCQGGVGSEISLLKAIGIAEAFLQNFMYLFPLIPYLRTDGFLLVLIPSVSVTNMLRILSDGVCTM
jgi:hypothetical protein